MDHVEDMKELIRTQIRSMDNLQERVAFKALMEQVFLAMYETNEQMYQDLEKRVQEELTYDVNRYLVRTGLIERAYYDVSHHMMAPMEQTDLQGAEYKLSDIRKIIEDEGSYSLQMVMLRCDYLQVQKIWSEDLEFQGSIETKSSEEPLGITVKLRQNTSYLKKIGQLYRLFVKNGIPWQTVNAPYLYKLADIVLTKLPEGIEEKDSITNIQIDFGRYGSVICGDLIPVWNIQKLRLDGTGFPIPCEDRQNFEHAISLHEHGSQHAYLVEDAPDIQNVAQRGEKLFIISGSGASKKWDIYRIHNAKDGSLDHYTYPVMQNQREETFTERYQRKWGQSVRTRAELERFVKGFGLGDYVVYEDCRIQDGFEAPRETYSMNSFIEDEIRDRRDQKKLILYFKAGAKEEWLQRDIASFLVSEVQRIYPEYECGGIVL